MNDNELTDLMERVASDYWDSRIFIDGRAPWSETPRDKQNALKEAILPWVFRAAPLLTAKVGSGVHRFIEQAREVGATDTEIVDQLLLEMAGA